MPGIGMAGMGMSASSLGMPPSGLGLAPPSLANPSGFPGHTSGFGKCNIYSQVAAQYFISKLHLSPCTCHIKTCLKTSVIVIPKECCVGNSSIPLFVWHKLIRIWL